MPVIQFIEKERTEFLSFYMAYVGKVMIGEVRIYRYNENVPELNHVWLTDRGKQIVSFSIFLSQLYKFFKEKGYTGLWMQSEDEDTGSLYGFKLESWDNSGWYPKYYFYREL